MSTGQLLSHGYASIWDYIKDSREVANDSSSGLLICQCELGNWLHNNRGSDRVSNLGEVGGMAVCYP